MPHEKKIHHRTTVLFAKEAHDKEAHDKGSLTTWVMRNLNAKDTDCRHTKKGASNALDVTLNTRAWSDPRFVAFVKKHGLVTSKTTHLHFLFFHDNVDEELTEYVDVVSRLNRLQDEFARITARRRAAGKSYNNLSNDYMTPDGHLGDLLEETRDELDQCEEDLLLALETTVRAAIHLLDMGERFDTLAWGKNFPQDIDYVVGEGHYGTPTKQVLMAMYASRDALHDLTTITDEWRRNQAIYDYAQNLLRTVTPV